MSLNTHGLCDNDATAPAPGFKNASSLSLEFSLVKLADGARGCLLLINVWWLELTMLASKVTTRSNLSSDATCWGFIISFHKYDKIYGNRQEYGMSIHSTRASTDVFYLFSLRYKINEIIVFENLSKMSHFAISTRTSRCHLISFFFVGKWDILDDFQTS